MQARIARGVHELDAEIDALGRRVGLFRRHDVFFAQDRRLPLDEQSRALIAIGDQAFAEDEPLAGFQFDLEAHSMPLLAAACRSGRGVRTRPSPRRIAAVTGTIAARFDRPAKREIARWTTVAGGSARREGSRLPGCCRRA